MSVASKPKPAANAKAGVLIAVGTKLHPEARRMLRIAAAESGYNTAEALRSILYSHFGLEHLPVVLDAEPASD